MTGRVVAGRALTLVLGVAIAALAGCDGDSEQMPDDQSASEPVRLGCGQYCQQAGEIGDGATGKPALSIDTGSPVETLPDDTLPIAMTCLLPTPCEGVILLHSFDLGRETIEAGRSDLVVEANSPRTIAVPLSKAAREALQDGPIKVAVTANLLLALETLPKGERRDWKLVVGKEIVVETPASAAP